MQVLRYLQAFAATFKLHQYVRFDTEVTQAVPIASDSQEPQPNHHQTSAAASGNQDVPTNRQSHAQSSLPWPKWQITTQAVHYQRQRNSTEALLQREQADDDQASSSQSSDAQSHSAINNYASHSGGNTHTNSQTAASSSDSDSPPHSDTQTDSHRQTATYDALVVCNGHYSAPRCPDVEGADVFPGQVMHSHNYRDNEGFRGQTVVLVGASASGEDICREIAQVADKVCMASNSMSYRPCIFKYSIQAKLIR